MATARRLHLLSLSGHVADDRDSLERAYVRFRLQGHVFDVEALIEHVRNVAQDSLPLTEVIDHEVRGECGAIGGKCPYVEAVHRAHAAHPSHRRADLIKGQVQGHALHQRVQRRRQE